MKVTKLTAQQKNQNRVNVFIDGKYELSLTIDQVLENKVKVDLELDETDLKKLNKLSEDGKLEARALEWALSRPHSQKELKDYLIRKRADPELIDSISKKFAIRNFVNDEDFTVWWIDNRVRKNKSDLSIKSELRAKGVNQDIIAKHLQHADSTKTRLKNLIVSKKLKYKYPDEQKLKQYLAGKGFIYSDIVDVLAELNEGEDFIA